MKKFLVLQNVACEGLGTLDPILKKQGYRSQIIRLFQNENTPNNLRNYVGLIVLGGPMSVHDTDQFPFLHEANRLIKNAIQRGLPTIGICLGSQLIAKSLGFRVYAGESKEIGWFPITLTDEAKFDPVFGDLPNRLNVFHWHGDTFDLPTNSIRLASSDLFPNQAFRYGRKIYAIQFHFEVTAAMIEMWMVENAAELQNVGIHPAEIRDRIPDQIDDLNRHAETVFSNFLQHVVS